MTLSYHPDAEQELIEAARFYEDRLPGLGADFLDEIDDAVATILEAPNRWREVGPEIRRYSVSRFPYALYYRVRGDIVRVLVVKHHSRHPDYWKYRIQQ